MSDFKATRDSIAEKTRELLAVRVDHDGRRLDPPTTPPPPAEEQPTGPRAPAADPTQGTRNAGMPGEKTNRQLIAEARHRAGWQ